MRVLLAFACAGFRVLVVEAPVVSPESQEVMRRADPTPKAVGRATRKGASIQMQQALVVSLLSFDFLRLRQLPTIAPMSHLLL